MWIGDIEDYPVTQETLAESLEAALQAIEQADAACSREWALHFIGQVRHDECRQSDGQLRALKHTLLSQIFSTDASLIT
jgi:hypothetical protein